MVSRSTGSSDAVGENQNGREGASTVGTSFAVAPNEITDRPSQISRTRWKYNQPMFSSDRARPAFSSSPETMPVIDVSQRAPIFIARCTAPSNDIEPDQTRADSNPVPRT